MSGPLLRQVPEEFDRLRAIFLERQPKSILEIGVWNGATLWEWVTNAPSGASIVAVDYFAEDVPQQARKDFHTWRSDVRLVSIAGDSTKPETIEKVRKFAPYDWVFIDGSHVLADVASDWVAYGSMVERGVVAFHDVAPHTRPGFDSEAPILWERIRAAANVRRATGLPYRTEQLIAEPPQGWAGIGVVYIGGAE